MFYSITITGIFLIVTLIIIMLNWKRVWAIKLKVLIPSTTLRLKIVKHLQKNPTVNTSTVLKKLLKHPNKEICWRAVDAFGMISDARGINTILPFLRDSDALVRKYAEQTLTRLGWTPDSDIDMCLKLLARRDWPRLCEYGSIARKALLIGLYDTWDAEIRKTCASRLLMVVNDLSAKLVLPALKDKEPGVRASVAEILGHIGNPKVRRALERALVDDDQLVRLQSIRALARIRDEHSMPKLANCLTDRYEETQLAAVEALCSFGNKGVEIVFEWLGEGHHLMRKTYSYLLNIGERQRVYEKLFHCVELAKYYGQRREAANLLQEFGWKPSNSHERIVFFQASGKYKELLQEGGEGRDKVLLALKAPETRKEAYEVLKRLGELRWALDSLCEILKSTHGRMDRRAFTTLICMGVSSTVPVLIETQNRYGNSETATELLNCGYKRLEKAARDWAAKHGYEIYSTPYGSDTRWGSL